MVESLSVKDELNILRKQTVKLSPFLNTVFLYFVLVVDPPVDQPDQKNQLSTTFLKCAPIVSLMVYIFLKGIKVTDEYRKTRQILMGLVFSCAGDALLNNDLFPHGMGAFALAQLCYISTFGFKPLKAPIGGILYAIAALFVAFLYKGLDEVLVIGLPVYATLLMTMCWRAIARGIEKKNFFSVFCAVGSVFFVISDGLIAVNMFFVEVPNARIWIMSTYYFAQLAITLSTALEFEESKAMPKRSKPSVQSRISAHEDQRKRFKAKD